MKVTETEYETVEQEIERYKCDHCGVVVDEEDINLVRFCDGPTIPADGDAKEHFCEGCVGLREAMDRREQVNALRERWEAFAGTVSVCTSVLWVVGAFVVGIWSTFFLGLTVPEQVPETVIVEGLIVGGIFSLFFLGVWTMIILTVSGRSL